MHFMMCCEAVCDFMSVTHMPSKSSASSAPAPSGTYNFFERTLRLFLLRSAVRSAVRGLELLHALQYLRVLLGGLAPLLRELLRQVGERGRVGGLVGRAHRVAELDCSVLVDREGRQALLAVPSRRGRQAILEGMARDGAGQIVQY